MVEYKLLFLGVVGYGLLCGIHARIDKACDVLIYVLCDQCFESRDNVVGQNNTDDNSYTSANFKNPIFPGLPPYSSGSDGSLSLYILISAQDSISPPKQA